MARWLLIFAALCFIHITQVSAVGECATSACDITNANCVDEGDYGYATCECIGQYAGRNCDRSVNIQVCESGHIYEQNALVQSDGYPAELPHRFSCFFLVRMHGVTTINLTVIDFSLENSKDFLIVGFDYYPEFNSPNRTEYHNGTLLESQVINSNQFWVLVETDRNVPSEGYSFMLSGDGDDCLSESVPCMNGGTCIDLWQNYTCMCPPGYAGDRCEVDIDECSSSPCMNGATCMDEINAYSCECLPGYDGPLCQNDIDECLSDPCQNGGTCNDLVNGYTCTCIQGYTGDNCEIDVDDCASNPCQNGATCNDGINSYTCDCAPGFEGDRCEIDIDECASNPCLNDGNCTDGINMFTCQCTAEWTGARCEISLNACRSDPCQYGGTCENDETTYRCYCVPGFTGRNCEIDINECSSLPCQNGGRCMDGPNMYSCQCLEGFTGLNCEEVGFCDLDGDWYNECNDRITLSRTSTGMLLGMHHSNAELITGYSGADVLVGFADTSCHFPTFGYVVSRDNGESTTSWTGQCHLCDGEEVLYTTWTNTQSVNTCSEIKKATLVGQDKWTRFRQSQAPREDI
ncbi:fibropellin-3-like [Diadema antillarum]|uniref:fibropellin-3-like n=1 Tax=Diadema antillarum TaxID=105358 RepID=UPI003A83A135